MSNDNTNDEILLEETEGLPDEANVIGKLTPEQVEKLEEFTEMAKDSVKDLKVMQSEITALFAQIAPLVEKMENPR